MNRQQVASALATVFSVHFNGRVRADYDDARRAYYIQGDNLPAVESMRMFYQNGWSLFSYLSPSRARLIARGIISPAESTDWNRLHSGL